MLLFPHAKINLGLNVLARREDGFHDIESLMIPVRLFDVLEAIIAPELGTNGLEYTRTGSPIPGTPEQDLCYKAVRQLQNERPLPGLRVHLHKVIPMGAGLGGGSSDGAHTLLLVNRLCELNLGSERLASMALDLGSDCPFFLQERACVARGRGERLTPTELNLTGDWLLLANPGIHVNTAEVYRNTAPTNTPWTIEQAVHADRRTWSTALPNTMERYVLDTYPVVGVLKEALIEAGAYYSAMSGSGSSVFGLFHDEPEIPEFPQGTRYWKLPL